MRFSRAKDGQVVDLDLPAKILVQLAEDHGDVIDFTIHEVYPADEEWPDAVESWGVMHGLLTPEKFREFV